MRRAAASVPIAENGHDYGQTLVCGTARHFSIGIDAASHSATTADPWRRAFCVVREKAAVVMGCNQVGLICARCEWLHGRLPSGVTGKLGQR